MLAEVVVAKQNLFFEIMGEITVSHDDIDNNISQSFCGFIFYSLLHGLQLLGWANCNDFFVQRFNMLLYFT